MPWRLMITSQAQRDLSKAPTRDRDAINRALDHMIADPHSADIKKLAGQEGYWRLRVGAWRAILRMNNAEGIIYVVRVLPRSIAYRD